MAAKLSIITTVDTVDMQEDWHIFGDAPLYQDELRRWSGQVDETESEEVTTGWTSYEKSPIDAWADRVQNELDTAVNPLPSPSEEQWLDFNSEYFTNNGYYNVPHVSSLESVEREGDNCVISTSENVQQDVETASCSELEDVVDMLLQREDLSELIEQVGTVDCSQLELLLTETADIGNMMTSYSAVEARITQLEQFISSSDSENNDGDDSDCSYSGQIGRRYSSRNGRQVRLKPCKRLSKNVKFERKKEQNKNAATRYREKKRNEEKDNEIECRRLETRNQELRARVKAMSHEVDVLRKLIVDIFRNGSLSD